MHNLEVQWRYRPSIATGIALAKGNVWSRASRRKKQQSMGDSQTLSDCSYVSDQGETALGVKIRLTVKQHGAVSVLIRWLQGRDSVLFESFCGMLKRRLSTPVS